MTGRTTSPYVSGEQWTFSANPLPATPFFSVDEVSFDQDFEEMEHQPRVTRLAPFFDDELLPFDEPFELEPQDQHE